ncbi:MAG: lipid-binding SYLF domain-containing protein [Desulfobacterales bacterium]|nr:lipid-binding SYLF domain-containing protein [Desulfobacterales bacterium]
MKHVALLLSIVCLLVFVSCGQGDKTEKATVSAPEKATEMVKAKAPETTEMAKEKAEETTQMVKEKAEETTVMATEQQGLVDKARVTFESFMADKNQSWLQENLNQAKGLIIIPSLLKAGFVVGGSGGSGLLIVKDDKTGQWSQPAFYTLGSGTFGLQIGAEAAEIIMMVRTQKAVDRLFTSSFKLGGDTSVAVGPVGTGVKSNVVADIFSFSRTKGAYAGVSLEGSVFNTKDKWNEAYYGKAVSPADIIVKRSVSNPGSRALRESVAKASAGK